jgi:hypothetical protein
MPSATSSSSSGDSDLDSDNNNKSSGFFDSPGKVAGTFVAVGVVVLAIVGTLLYFFCFKKRSDDDDDDDSMDLENSNSSATNHEKFGPIPPISAASPTDPNYSNHDTSLINKTMTDENGENFDFVEVDQRLDPSQVFNWQNGSRASLADDMDYTRRVLRVTNA